MGLSSSKTKTKTTPIYGTQIQNAGNTLASTYNQQAPKIAGYADQIGSLVPSLLEQFRQGNPALNAANDYVTHTLDGSNPLLEDAITRTNNDVRNQSEAALGLKGLTGGSSYADIISRNVGNSEGNMRLADLNRQQAAAGLAPALAAGGVINITPLLAAAQTASGLPLDAASQYAAGTGGLLGQYTNTTQKQSGGLLGSLLGAGLAGWASGGFKGLGL